MTFNIEKTAENVRNKNNKKKPEKYKDNSFVPEALGLTAAALIGANVYKKGWKGLAPAKDGALMGIGRNLRFKKMNVPKMLESVKRVGDSGLAKSKGYYKQYSKDLAKLKKSHGLKLGDPISKFKGDLPKGASIKDKLNHHLKTPDIVKDLAKNSRKKVEYSKDIAKDLYDDFAKKQNIKVPYSKLDPGSQKEFKNYVKKSLGSDSLNLERAPKNIIDHVKREAGLADGIKTYSKSGPDGLGYSHLKDKQIIDLLQNKGKSHGFRDASAAGAGFAGTSLAVHALGEKYFDKKDDDKVRRIVRDSYKSEIVPGGKHRKPLPNERVRRMQGREKTAALKMPSKVPEKLKYILKSDATKDNVAIAAGALVDGAMIGTLPAALSLMTKRDIRNGFKKLDTKNSDGDSGNVVIDIPMKQYRDMTKTAGINAKKALDRIKESERAMKFLADRKRGVIRVLPWSVGMTAAAGLNSKLDSARLNSSDLREGHARLTIQTPKSNRNKQDDFMMMKRASLEDVIENIRKDIEAKKGGTAQDKEDGLKKAVNFKPTDGITGKQYQFRMHQ